MMPAASCPISNSQIPVRQPTAPPLRSIPMAFDLTSLINTVNAIREVLQSLTSTTSITRTVNNLYLPRPPNFKQEGNKYYSQYPNWEEVAIETAEGFVTNPKDKSQRVFVLRQNRVHYQNITQNDPEFKWSYVKAIK